MHLNGRTTKALASIAMSVMVASCNLFDGASTPAVTDSIVFVSNRDSQIQLYIMRGDGSQVRRLTNGPGSKDHPAFSPDGKRVVFEMPDTVENSAQLLYVINSDGSGLKQLTFGRELDRFPSWSPDGTQIVFASTRARNFYLGIFVMSADGSDLHGIDVDQATNFAPSWSASANNILFASVRASVGRTGVYAMSSSGDAKHLVIDGSQPQWSPTGSRFAFGCAYNELCVTRSPDASVVDTLAIGLNGVGGVSTPKWSPDESRIAFVRRSTSLVHFEIWTSRTDGSDQVSLTSADYADDWNPDWSRH
jgi:Tol biopolymer transport system component